MSIETAQSNLDPSVLEHLPGKTIILGVLDLSTPTVESPERGGRRGSGGRCRSSTPDRVVLAPDCGMKYLPRASADGKMRSMVAAAGELRQEAAG